MIYSLVRGKKIYSDFNDRAIIVLRTVLHSLNSLAEIVIFSFYLWGSHGGITFDFQPYLVRCFSFPGH